MQRTWHHVAYSLALTSITCGASLVLRPPVGAASYTLGRLDDLTGGVSPIGIMLLALGTAGLLALVTGHGIRAAFGAAAVVFAVLAATLLAAAIYAGAGWVAVALSANLAAMHIVVVRAAARAEAAAAELRRE